MVTLIVHISDIEIKTFLCETRRDAEWLTQILPAYYDWSIYEEHF